MIVGEKSILINQQTHAKKVDANNYGKIFNGPWVQEMT